MYRKRIRMNGSLKKIMLIANVILWIIVNVGIFLIARESLDANRFSIYKRGLS